MDISFLQDRMWRSADQPAVIANETVFTFREILGEYNQAIALLDENKVEESSIVSLYADFSPTSIAYMLALISLDCIIVPISPSVVKMDYYLKTAQSEFFIKIEANKPEIVSLDKAVTHMMLLEMKKTGTPGLIFFSSGTTGSPKAAVHDLNKLLEKCKRLGKTLRTISFLLFDHIGGFNTMMHSVANGGTIVTVGSRDPVVVCAAIAKHKVELLPASPTFLNLLLLNRMYEAYDLSSLKIISYGTEPMPQSTLNRLHEVMPYCTFKQTYGLSEIGIMSSQSENSRSLWMKLGGEGYETRIVDGILHIRAKSAMLGYLNAPSPFDEEGWFNTQDRVETKGEYFKIIGRLTDIINVGGEKVYPIEVESVLLECEGVLDARVSGEPHLLVGNIVKAEVYVGPEHNNREFIRTLREFCVSRLEKFKIPVKFTLEENSFAGTRLKKNRYILDK